jgi:hypothetical protein
MSNAANAIRIHRRSFPERDLFEVGVLELLAIGVCERRR